MLDNPPVPPEKPDVKQEELKEIRAHCWAYFQFHGDQRMRLFHFYLIVTAAVYAGITTLAKENGLPCVLVSMLAATHCLLSYVFSLLDRRHKDFIHVAQVALKHIEKTFPDEKTRVFTNEAVIAKDISDLYNKGANWSNVLGIFREIPRKEKLKRLFLDGSCLRLPSRATCGSAFRMIYNGFIMISGLISIAFDMLFLQKYISLL